jgi:ketosteroid isomerase-like protein
MRPQIRLVAVLLFSAISLSGSFGQTSGKASLVGDRLPRCVLDAEVGKYLTVWKKDADGAWKVLLDTYNSDLPPR